MAAVDGPCPLLLVLCEEEEEEEEEEEADASYLLSSWTRSSSTAAAACVVDVPVVRVRAVSTGAMTRFAPTITSTSGSSWMARVAACSGWCFCTVTRPSRWTVIASMCCPGVFLCLTSVVSALVRRPTLTRSTPFMSYVCHPSVAASRCRVVVDSALLTVLTILFGTG